MHLNLLEKKLNSNLLYSYVILIILWMSTIYYLIDKKFHTHAHEHICIYIHTYILWGQFLSSLVNQTSGTLSPLVIPYMA